MTPLPLDDIQARAVCRIGDSDRAVVEKALLSVIENVQKHNMERHVWVDPDEDECCHAAVRKAQADIEGLITSRDAEIRRLREELEGRA